MLIVVHSLWGLTIATQTQNPILLFLGGVGGHILLDVIPHRDLTTIGQVIIDIFFAASLSLLLMKIFSLNLIFAWSVLFSTLPDVDVAIRYFGKGKGIYFPSHLPSWHGNLHSPLGILINLLVGLALLVIFLILKK